MFISELDWDDYRIEHIARHSIDPEEVWEVCLDSRHLAHREGPTRFRIYGQTRSGRYLFIVVERLQTTVYRPITARDMTEKEKQGFRRLKR